MTPHPYHLEILAALGACAPPVIAQWSRTRSRCILATAMGLDALAYFQVPADPVVVNVMAGNAAWWAWYQAGIIPPMPPDAWSVGVHETFKGSGGWSGHLLIGVEVGPVWWGLDLDCQQFSRPERGMPLPPAVCVELDREAGGGSAQVGPTALIYVLRPGDHSYRRSPDWRRARRRREAVGAIIRAMKTTLARAVAHGAVRPGIPFVGAEEGEGDG